MTSVGASRTDTGMTILPRSGTVPTESGGVPSGGSSSVNSVRVTPDTWDVEIAGIEYERQ
jgi:hypothetical protein